MHQGQNKVLCGKENEVNTVDMGIDKVVVATTGSQDFAKLGWALYFKNKYDEAITAFNKALKSNPLSQSALRGKGWSCLQKGDYDICIRLLTKALDIINPNAQDQYNEALRGLAWAFFHKGKYQKALEFFERAIKFTDPTANHLLRDINNGIGLSNKYLAQFDYAIDAFNKALDHNTGIDENLWQHKITAELNLATIGKKLGGLNESYLATWVSQVNSNTALSELGAPEIIEIEPAYMCNLRCIQCHASYEDLGKNMIRPDFVKQLKGLEGKWVIVGSSFEPFTHPQIHQILLDLSNLNMKIDLTTNGTLLTKKTTERLAECSFDNFTVSFDGIRKETYESIRRNADYEKTLDRILNFKDAMREKVSFFTINNTLMKRNINEVLESVEFWEKQGFDHIGLILMVVRDMNEILKEESLEHMMDYVSEKVYEVAEAMIERKYKITVSSSIFDKPSEFKARHSRNFQDSCVKSDNPDSKIPFNPRTFFMNGDFPGMHVACRSPFKAARIMWSGDVEICYKFIIGNIFENDFMDIWYGRLANKFRNEVLSNPKICLNCEYYKFCIMGGEVDYSEHDNFYNNEVLPGIIRQGYSKNFLITVLLTKIFRRLRRKILRLTDIKNGKICKP